MRDFVLEERPRFFSAVWLPLLFVLIGCGLRLLWPTDMEWKADEKANYQIAEQAAAQSTWPVLGIRGSTGMLNPGMSVWPFILIARFVHDPVTMGIVIEWVNVISLLGLFFLVLWQFPPERRGPWLWGVALFAVSSVPILLSRKIWSPCLCPPLFAAFLYGQWNRARWWGAALWGLAGTLLGQIHLAGFFAVGGVFLFTVVADLLKGRWRWSSLLVWGLATTVGSLPLIPWYVQQHGAFTSPHDYFGFRFYSVWFGTPWGLNSKYSISDAFYREFLAEPRWHGTPTYLVAALHLYLVSEVGRVLFRFFSKRLRQAHRRWLWSDQPEFALLAAGLFWGMGLALTLTGASVSTHYLVPIFPVLFVWVATALWDRPRRLVWVTAAQLMISVCLLTSLHRQGGDPQGGFGVMYRVQVTPRTAR